MVPVDQTAHQRQKLKDAIDWMERPRSEIADAAIAKYGKGKKRPADEKPPEGSANKGELRPQLTVARSLRICEQGQAASVASTPDRLTCLSGRDAIGPEEKPSAGGKGQPKRKRAESPTAKKEATQAPRRASQGDASRDKGAPAVKKETVGKPAPVREAGQPRTQEPQNGKRPR